MEMILAVSDSVTAVWDRLASDVLATDIAPVPPAVVVDAVVEMGDVTDATGSELEIIVMAFSLPDYHHSGWISCVSRYGQCYAFRFINNS